MRVINATEYNSYDSDTSQLRHPNTRVFCKRNYDSIPFEGKTLQSTTTSERYPKHILHDDGRLCMVFSKYNSTHSKWDLYYKSTNTTRTTWNSIVEIAQNNSYNYNTPAVVEILTSDNLGIITSRDGTDLYSCVIDTAGSIVTALSDTTINGTNPSVVTVGSTYWLFYERSDVVYYRTSSDFITWTAEVNFNTITGLSDAHNNPYVYYDASGNLWVVFERVTDTSASPVVKNVYTIMSDNDGVSWDSPVAQTTLVAGEGSCVNPSIIDTTSYRYISYTLEQNIQSYQDAFGDTHSHNFFVVDETNNRVGMITGINYSGGFFLCIYDRDTSLYTNHDLKAHGLTSGSVTCLGYDETNKIWVIGTYYDGLITYDENTTTWSQYKTTSTPAILGDLIPNQIMAVEDKKVYFVSHSGATSYRLQKLDLTAGTNTQLSTLGALYQPYQFNTFLSTTYAVCIVRASNIWDYLLNHPTVFVFNKTTDTELYNEKMSDGSQYKCAPSTDTAGNLNYRYAQFAWDEINNVIYSLASDTNETDDSGIIKYTVGDSALTFANYYSQLDANSTGLLPNPDVASDKVAFINNLVYNSTNNKLYIEVYTTTNSAGGVADHAVSVMNTTTELIIENYAPTNSDAWTANWTAIDDELIKVLPLKQYIYFNSTSQIACTDDKEFIFYHDTQSGDRYFWNILSTEGLTNRVYYRRTSDDITWVAQAYLTTNSEDGNINLGYSDSRLKAFWNIDIDGTYELRWDEDLSAEIDISEYIESVNRFMTIENEANHCGIKLSDDSGLFSPINYNSLYYDYLQENNIIRIEKGNNTNYTPFFYGLIGAGDANQSRGDGNFYDLTVWDMSKNYYKNKITTGLYESQTVAAIFTDVAANYMNLSASEYTAPSITTTIPQVQFIEELPMDILNKILQIDNYYADFDEEGVLVAKLINYEATTDFTYYEDGTDTIAANKAPVMNIHAINFSWDDNALNNKVIVLGQEEATEEEEFPEEFMGFLNGAAGWFSKRNQFEFYYSGDKQLKATQPRLVVQDSCGSQFFGGGESLTVEGGDFSVKQDHCIVNQNVSNLIAAIFVLIAAAQIWIILSGGGVGAVWVYNGLALVVSLGYTFLGQIGSYYYEIYARPIGQPIPDIITGNAQDDDLIEKYSGENILEIDNPLLSTLIQCNTLAENELEKAMWYRYNLNLVIMANLALQTGDVVSIYNPTFDLTYKGYIREISSSYSRGTVDRDEITLALIT